MCAQLPKKEYMTAYYIWHISIIYNLKKIWLIRMKFPHIRSVNKKCLVWNFIEFCEFHSFLIKGFYVITKIFNNQIQSTIIFQSLTNPLFPSHWYFFKNTFYPFFDLYFVETTMEVRQKVCFEYE